MSLPTKVAVLGICFIAAVLAGCGGGSDNPSNPPAPPPGGSFGNANLNGTYIFSFSGFDRTNFNSSFFAIVGTLTANGNGSFTAGNIDVDDPALGAATSATVSRTRASVAGESIQLVRTVAARSSSPRSRRTAIRSWAPST